MKENNTNAQPSNIEARITIKGATEHFKEIMSESYLTFETLEELDKFINVIFPWYISQALILCHPNLGILGDMRYNSYDKFNKDYKRLSSLLSKGTIEIFEDSFTIIEGDGERYNLNLDHLDGIEIKDFYNLAKIVFPTVPFNNTTSHGIQNLISCECEAKIPDSTLIKYTYDIKYLNRFNSVTKEVYTSTYTQNTLINDKREYRYLLNIRIMGDVSRDDIRTSSSLVGFDSIEEMDRFVSFVLPWYFSEAIKHSPTGILSVEPQNIDYVYDRRFFNGFSSDYENLQAVTHSNDIHIRERGEIYVDTVHGSKKLCISHKEGIRAKDILRAFSCIEFPMDNSSTKYVSGIKDFKSITAECEIDDTTYIQYTFKLKPYTNGFCSEGVTKSVCKKDNVVQL